MVWYNSRPYIKNKIFPEFGKNKNIFLAPDLTPVSHEPDLTPITHVPDLTPITHVPDLTPVTLIVPDLTPVLHFPHHRRMRISQYRTGNNSCFVS